MTYYKHTTGFKPTHNHKLSENLPNMLLTIKSCQITYMLLSSNPLTIKNCHIIFPSCYWVQTHSSQSKAVILPIQHATQFKTIRKQKLSDYLSNLLLSSNPHTTKSCHINFPVVCSIQTHSQSKAVKLPSNMLLSSKPLTIKSCHITSPICYSVQTHSQSKAVRLPFQSATEFQTHPQSKAVTSQYATQFKTTHNQKLLDYLSTLLMSSNPITIKSIQYATEFKPTHNLKLSH